VSDPVKKQATYQDVLDAPEHKVAEIVDGELYLSPRPAGPHTSASSALGYLLGPPFQFGTGGPGGWIIHVEPELHFADDVVVPDLAGWRTERFPITPDEPYFTIAPDWVCEVLSRSTRRFDRTRKLPVYARAGIRHAWLVDPKVQAVEVLRLVDGSWTVVRIYEGAVIARVEPFDAIELDLGRLWAYFVPPPKGSRAAESEDSIW